MQRSPSCFISYCHHDVDRELIDYLVYFIRDSFKNDVEILYDSDLSPGTNLNKFMDRTLDVDVAVLLLTPSYKQRISQRKGGAYHEFTRITERFRIQEQRGDTCISSEDAFSLIPIILSGSFEESVPTVIRDLMCINLVGFTAIRDSGGEFRTTSHSRNFFAPEIDKLVGELVAVSQLKSHLFKAERERLYDALFVNTKTTSELLHRCPAFFKEVFVPTSAFEKVRLQHSYFLIGRKGSGKSTIASAMTEIEPARFNGTINISVDDIDLNSHFSILRPSTHADIRQFLPSLSFFEYAWQGFLCLCFIELLESLQQTARLQEQQVAQMQPVLDWISSFRGPTQIYGVNHKGAFSLFATNRLQEYVDYCIDTARAASSESQFLADVHIKFNVDGYLRYLVGDIVFESLVEIVSHCKKRVLVTLDDFDTIFDTFRRAATDDDDMRRRSEFERDWLRSLLLLVLSLKDTFGEGHKLFRTLDFCLTVPKDRFLEIQRSERDAYRYEPRTSSIDWSGVELCDVLLKRLEQVHPVSGKRPIHAPQALQEILRRTLPFIPDDVDFNFNGRRIKMPLFCYVLRHTFWRPRDIIMYYANILAAAFAVQRIGERLTTPVLRKVVSDTTYGIIKTEFLDEYQSVISNIRGIVNSFMEYPQVMPYDALERAIGSNTFAFTSGGGCDGMPEKIEFLYDIGFLGIDVDEPFQELVAMGMRQAFYFNEGRAPMRHARKREFRDIRFAIHPIFSENLQLSFAGNQFLLEFDWDYLKDNHLIKSAAPS